MAKAVSPFFLHALPGFDPDNMKEKNHYEMWEAKAREMNLAPVKITRELVDLLKSRGGSSMDITDEWSPFLYRLGQYVLLVLLPIGDDGRAYARVGYRLKVLGEDLYSMSITRDIMGDMDVVAEIEAFVSQNFAFRKECPKCQSPLVRKIAWKVKEGPRSFLSCEVYPICNGSSAYRIDQELASAYCGVSRAQIRRRESEPWRSKKSRIAHREYLERKGIRSKRPRRPTMEECERAEQERLPWWEP